MVVRVIESGLHTTRTLRIAYSILHKGRGITVVLLLLLLGAGQPQGVNAASTPRVITALTENGINVWAGSTDGLWQWSDGQFTPQEIPFEDDSVTALYHDGVSLWLGTYTGIARYTADSGWQSWQRGDSGLRSVWGTAFTTYQGMTVVGTYDSGVYGWDGATWSPLGTSPIRITALESNGNTLWAGTASGMWVWDGVTWRRESVPAPRSEIHDIDIFEDKLWVATQDGLFVRPLNSDLWSQDGANEPTVAITHVQATPLIATQTKVRGANGVVATTPFNAPITALVAMGNAQFIGTLGQGLVVQGAPTAAAPIKPPVVLIHGLGDSNNVRQSNLRFLATWLRADGYPVYYVAFASGATLTENVAAVQAMVTTARQEHDNQDVVLLAHSFGGLLAKTYAATYPEDVAGLVTMGTPHAGVRLAYDVLVTDLDDNAPPSTSELLPEHTALLDPFWTNAALPQLHIGGDLLPRTNFFEGFPAHDGIIDAASATAALGATRVVPVLHGWTYPTLRFGIPSYLYPITLYQTTVHPWLASLATRPLQGRVDVPPLASPGFAERPVFVGSIAPTERVVAAITLDAQPATWFLNGTSVEMTLIAPDGTRYAGDSARFGTTVSHLPYRENVLQPLDLWSTETAGTWQVELENSDSVAVDTRLTVIQPQGESIALAVTTPWVAPNETVAIEVQAPTGQTLTATLGNTQAAVAEVSAGLYRTTLVAPATAGYHPLRVSNGSLERWSVITVRSTAWTVGTVTSQRDRETVTIQFPVVGQGSVVLGTRLWQGNTLVDTRLSSATAINGQNVLKLTLPVATSANGLRVEWQLFDVEDTLVPAGPLVVTTLR